MNTILYQYLILHRQLSLPGIGTIHLQKSPASHDYANKSFIAPAYNFIIDTTHEAPAKQLFIWLSKKLNISDWEAIRLVNDFSFEMKNKISAGDANWENIGTLQRDEKGSIILISPSIELESEQPVSAEKVLRVNAGHTVRVGEMEKTSVEMEEMLTEQTEKKDYGWIIAIVITVIAVMFVGWYLSEKGVSPSSAGNQSVIQTK